MRSLLLILVFIFSNKLSYANEVYELEAERVLYKNNNNLIIAEGNASANNNLGEKIFADKIIYHKKKLTIHTFGNSKFLEKDTTINADNFSYNLKTKVITADKNVLFIDADKNKFYFDNLKYNQKNGYGDGKNLRAYFLDGSYLDSFYGEIDKKNGVINLKNSRYTTCSIKKNEFCPSWSLKSKKTTHLKQQKKIIHKNAFLKIKNIPVFYTPYISHPDPSVKRQRGFLPPTIKTLSNIGRTINMPYFIPIGEDKDITLTPVLYLNENSLIKTSFRQAYKNAFLNVESGYSQGYKNLNKTKNRTKGSRNYIFVDYKGNKKNILFENNNINFKLQRVSQSNFLRTNRINTKIFQEDIRSLENFIEIESFNQNTFFKFKTGIYENLDLPGSNKYTYYYPDGSFSKNFKILNKYNTNFRSYFSNLKFSSDQKQSKINNNLSLDSNQKILRNFGLISQYKFNVINNNIYNDNVTNLKEKSNIDNYFTFALDTKLPLAKINRNSYQILSPRIFLKYTTGKMNNINEQDKILNFSDIFSMNRGTSDAPETGLSLGHGIDYTIRKSSGNFKRNLYSASFGIGQVFRDNSEEKLPVKSSLNQKYSEFAGYFKYNLNGKENILNTEKNNKIKFLDDFKQNKISASYDFNLDNNLKQINKNYIDLYGSYENFFTSLKYLEKNNNIGSDRSGILTFKKLMLKNYFLKIESKKNLKTNQYEYNQIGLNFENDCIVTSLAFSENFYFDKDVSSSKSLIFSIVLKPFSDNIAPDLSNFIN